jgi:predicted metalloprotease with PDZ domain
VAVQKGAALAISAVVEGSPADRAGLSVRDELVALDGARVLPEEWEKRLEECDPGDRLRLTVFRAGYLREFTVTLGRKENVSWVVRKAKRPAPLQKKIYRGWLWCPWKKP